MANRKLFRPLLTLPQKPIATGKIVFIIYNYILTCGFVGVEAGQYWTNTSVTLCDVSCASILKLSPSNNSRVISGFSGSQITVRNAFPFANGFTVKFLG